MALPVTVADRPRLSVTVTDGFMVPDAPMRAVVPEVPVTVCPAKLKLHVLTDAPPLPDAFTVYCRRLTPCKHRFHPFTTALSLTTVTCKVAVGRMDSGT